MKVALFAPVLFLLTGCDAMVDAQMNDIHGQVVEDALAQYDIAARADDAMQKCVHAGLVAAAYMQAQDETNWNIWRSREKADCAEAGVPR